MVTFFGCVIIGVVLGYLIARMFEKSGSDKVNIIRLGTMMGIFLGIIVSFLAGSFVKREIIVEKYVISPMIFDGKPIVALVEDGLSYVFQIKEGDKTKLIKHSLSKKEIFFTDGSEERYLMVKRSKACRRNMWIWFFYGGTGIVKTEATFRETDNFLTLSRYYSL